MSAMDGSKLLQGRPYGGCAFLWNSDIKASITPISCESKRICAVLIDYGEQNNEFLFINVYMPTDCAENIQEYNEVLNEVSRLCEGQDGKYISIGGDFNTDFGRARSGHTLALQRFIQAETLRCGLTHVRADVDFTYESKINGSRSTLDHFIVSDNVFRCIEEYIVSHSGVNLSDHSSLQMSLKIPHRIEAPETLVSADAMNLSWDKSTPGDLDNYRNELDRILENVHIPFNALFCQDFMCGDHRN
jgi:hypothetical protein